MRWKLGVSHLSLPHGSHVSLAPWPSSFALSRQPKQTPGWFFPSEQRVIHLCHLYCPVCVDTTCLGAGDWGLLGKIPAWILEGQETSLRLCMGWSLPGVPSKCLGLWNELGFWDSHWRLFTCRFAWQVNSPQQSTSCQGLSGTISPSQRGSAWIWALSVPPSRLSTRFLPQQPRGGDSCRLSEPLPRATRGLPG